MRVGAGSRVVQDTIGLFACNPTRAGRSGSAAREAGSIRLFELAEPAVERCVLTYRAELKAADLERGAYLEMWCRFPGRGEFFSKGLQQKAKGTTGWSSYEVPFSLKAAERPDLIRLNVAFDGPGTLWVRNLELQQAPCADLVRDSVERVRGRSR